MPQATGGIETMKEIILLKIGKKYNICDRIIFALIQCDIREARKISSILDIFPYEFIAESLAKLHNNGLIFVDIHNGETILTAEVQKILDLYKEGQVAVIGDYNDGQGNLDQMKKNFSGVKSVMI